MKVDVEGMEMAILPDMVYSGALTVVDNLHIEFHPHVAKLDTREEVEMMVGAVQVQVHIVHKRMCM